MPDRTNTFLIEPEQYRTLLTLAEHPTFSAAATALGVQQSAISHQVRRMEERLRRRLFRRTGHGVQATADGEALIIYARAMLKLDDTVRRHFQAPGAGGELRIGIVEDLNRTALPAVLALFSRDHPSFEFRIASEQPSRLIKHVQDGHLDAAIVRHSGDLLGAEPLWADRLVWVGNAETPMPITDPVPLVLPPTPNALRDLVLGTLRNAGRTWRIPYEGVGLASLEAGLRAGLGIGAFPVNMERFGIDELGANSGLPPLPEMHYATVQSTPPSSDVVAAFCQVFKDAARLSFRTGQPAPS